ncbi:MAG: alpha/beta hydrolase [Proteobacteria bacterium]|nr:alpha/beta hydrolase [Pseudomonadota bacterium]
MSTTDMNCTANRHRPLKIPLFLLLGFCGFPMVTAQTNSQTGIASVNGTELYYEIAGDGHPLVLIHGGAVDSRAWDDQFSVFSQHYKVVRFDLRGAGKSGNRDKPFSNSQDLYSLLEFLNIDKTYLLGISRGGGFAYDLTLEHPEIVSALILVSANLSMHVPAYSKMFAQSTEAGKESGAAAAAEVWGNDPHQGPMRDSARPRVLEILTDNMPRFRYFDGHVPVERLRSSDIPRSQRLTEVQIPTLVISGKHDNAVAKTHYRDWAAGIPNANLVEFPNAAHLVNIDQVDEFNQTVLEFLNDL